MNASQTLNSKYVDFLSSGSTDDHKRPSSVMSVISECHHRKRRCGYAGPDKDEKCLLVGQHPHTERVEPLSLHETSSAPFDPQFEVKEHRLADAPKLFERYNSPQQREAETEAKSSTEKQCFQTDKKFDEIASPPYSSITSAIKSSEEGLDMTASAAPVLQDKGKHKDVSGPETSTRAPATGVDDAKHLQKQLPDISSLFCSWQEREDDICPVKEIRDLPDPEHSDMLLPLSTKWRILGPKPKQSDHALLIAQVKKQLDQQGVPNAKECHVHIPPNTGKASYLMVGFNTETEYDNALKASIKLGNVDCRLITGCP